MPSHNTVAPSPVSNRLRRKITAADKVKIKAWQKTPAVQQVCTDICAAIMLEQTNTEVKSAAALKLVCEAAEKLSVKQKRMLRKGKLSLPVSITTNGNVETPWTAKDKSLSNAVSTDSAFFQRFLNLRLLL